MDGRPIRLTWLFLASLLALLLLLAPHASGQDRTDLKERMEEIQSQLDATTARIEELRTDEDNLKTRIATLDERIAELGRKNEGLERRAVQRARSLYIAGQAGMVEAILSADDLSELTSDLEYFSAVSNTSTALFLSHARSAKELGVVRAEADARAQELALVGDRLASESDRLQQAFVEAKDDYEEFVAEARRAASQVEETAPVQPNVTQPVVPPPNPAGMVCPIAGPNSFIDSWGYPRSGGRTHEGTDMMAAMGTPVVAIRDGSITYAGYGSSAGNWIVLSGDDGNSYWYMHNQENLITGGRVSVGQQIATVGNTGNASGGPPHVHFEYHPGGGGPINPYPLLAGLC